jgi:hypothetical protein
MVNTIHRQTVYICSLLPCLPVPLSSNLNFPCSPKQKSSVSVSVSDSEVHPNRFPLYYLVIYMMKKRVRYRRAVALYDLRIMMVRVEEASSQLCALFCDHVESVPSRNSSDCLSSDWKITSNLRCWLRVHGVVIAAMTRQLSRITQFTSWTHGYVLVCSTKPATVQSTHTDPLCWCELRLLSKSMTIYVCQLCVLMMASHARRVEKSSPQHHTVYFRCRQKSVAGVVNKRS